jgi:hypothetical protein
MYFLFVLENMNGTLTNEYNKYMLYESGFWEERKFTPESSN